MGDIVAEVAAAQVDRAVRGPRLRVALEHPGLLTPIAQIAGALRIDEVILERAVLDRS